MKLTDIFKDKPEKPPEDYFRRNAGKKLMATILAPTEKELKEQQEKNDPTNIG